MRTQGSLVEMELLYDHWQVYDGAELQAKLYEEETEETLRIKVI